LCFAINLTDGVIIAADGRLTKQFKAGGNESGFDYFPKLQPLTKNSVMFIGGLLEPCEMIRHEVKTNLSSRDLTEIINLIQSSSIKHAEKYNDLVRDEDGAVSGTVLAYYDEKPYILSFSNVDGYKPMILAEIGNYGFRGVGQDIAVKHFQSKLKVGKLLFDAIFETFKEVNKVVPEVGGVFSAYFINKNGVELIGERMI